VSRGLGDVYKRQQKYISKSRGKATWSSTVWVLEAASEYSRDAEHLEIHIFPIQSAIKVPYLQFKSDLFKENAAKEAAKKKKMEEKKKKMEANRLDYDIAEAEKKLAELKAKKNEIK
jgi:hypothetical protein